ncbi:MAG: aryl-sulfate sulfotransferase [Bdellovibrionales bacterium]|nr:aryl-sulfate sulfotransferase [Bdellovibrionales bacterium]
MKRSGLRSKKWKEAVLLVALLACVGGVVVYFESDSTPDARARYSPPQQASVIGRLTVFERGESFPGYTLYPMCGNAEVHLLNHEGKSVHVWPVDADRARLLPNGNLLVVHASKWGLSTEKWKKLRRFVREYSWDGKVVWEKQLDGPAHHDIQRLSNGNTLALVITSVPMDDPVRSTIQDPFLRTAGIRSDEIQEISPSGEIMWNWKFHEHVDINSCGAEQCPDEFRDKVVQGERNYDWSHTNTISVIPENHWFEVGDERFRPGNIMVLPRNWSTAMIIDKASKEIVWRYSGSYRNGLSGGHEAHMISKGLPGAGNVLILDNGRDRKESYVLEIDPVSQETVWAYDVGEQFFTRAAGSMQRLPNGNTLISEDLTGRVFEVTPTKKVVWEFTRAYKGEEAMTRINRAQRYPLGFLGELEADLRG